MARETSTELKQLINNFIQAKRDDKLKKATKKTSSEAKIKQIYKDYTPANWIEKASKRVAQIQLVTHAVKYTHPDAQGSSFYLETNGQKPNQYVSTRSLQEPTDDVVGNAAALDVYKFLKLKLTDDNESLLARMLRNDQSLREALPVDDTTIDQWFHRFCAIKQPKNRVATHRLAKQVYFPVRNGLSNYHIVAPLYPSALSHVIYQRVQQRYSHLAFEARQAYKNQQPHAERHRVYVNLAVQHFGGDNQQNISQLNSERRGQGYLLPSLPPQWQSQSVKAPLQESIFPAFEYHNRSLIQAMSDFLERVQHTDATEAIRRQREAFVDQIMEQLIGYTAAIQNIEGGWSARADCQLNEYEALWLDPGRGDMEEEWQQRRVTTDWLDAVADRFAFRLNQALRTNQIQLDDDVYREWKKRFKQEINLLEEDA